MVKISCQDVRKRQINQHKIINLHLSSATHPPVKGQHKFGMQFCSSQNQPIHTTESQTLSSRGEPTKHSTD